LTFPWKSHKLKLSRIVFCGFAAMAEKTPTINLLPDSGDSFLTQFFNWALTIGRLLIILTEMVALGTFIYRFGLDMQIVDLHDKIKAESFIVANFKDAEATFRDIQERLATVKRYTSVGATTTSTFTDIAKMGEGKVTFKDLTITTNNAKIEVAAPSASSLTQFVDLLKNYPAVSSVSIDKVENNTTSAQIIVNISATLKQQAFAPTETQTNNTGGQATLNP
jgi:hypothetical protein